MYVLLACLNHFWGFGDFVIDFDIVILYERKYNISQVKVLYKLLKRFKI